MRRTVRGRVQSVGEIADTGGMDAPERPRPILSTFADDPAQQDLIDAFVVALAERVDELQDLEARGELDRLARCAEALLGDARKAGYDALSRSAAGVRSAALESQTQEARKALIELTEVSQLVRLGHRGAA
jgi:hypothetical protein